jgi:hypothetical protein
LAIVVEVDKVEIALAFTQNGRFRTVLTSEVLRLHRFSLKDVWVGIYCMKDVSLSGVIPFQIARA